MDRDHKHLTDPIVLPTCCILPCIGLHCSLAHLGAMPCDHIEVGLGNARQIRRVVQRCGALFVSSPSRRERQPPSGRPQLTRKPIGGRYCEDCEPAEINDGPGFFGIRSYALDPDRAKHLWSLSEAMGGDATEYSGVADSREEAGGFAFQSGSIHHA